jgi:type VI protein secretion system component VasK
MLKQLATAASGSAEASYGTALNDAWDGALRSLFMALISGRCPYAARSRFTYDLGEFYL